MSQQDRSARPLSKTAIIAAERKARREAREAKKISDAARLIAAREVAADTGIDYIEVQRRISEVAFIRKTEETRDGCKVWEAV